MRSILSRTVEENEQRIPSSGRVVGQGDGLGAQRGFFWAWRQAGGSGVCSAMDKLLARADRAIGAARDAKTQSAGTRRNWAAVRAECQSIRLVLRREMVEIERQGEACVARWFWHHR